MRIIQVIVASVNQKDLDLFYKMNIKSNLIIANQCDECMKMHETINGYDVLMINSDTIGVGKNRNIGLLYASDEVLLFADDDIVYKDDYEKIVIKAFEEIPEADIIIFQMEFEKNGEIYDVDRHSTKKVHLWNGLSYGTYQVAVKRESILRKNIHFTHLFGGGCIYSAGEDSLFLIDCFKKGLEVYTYNRVIGKNVRNSSTWFQGFNEKFFYDRGAFLACAFPKAKYIMLLYYMVIYRKKTEMSVINTMKMMFEGIKGYRELRKYNK